MPVIPRNRAVDGAKDRARAMARSLPQALHVQASAPSSTADSTRVATRLAWRLFLSHGVLATILLVAVGITLSGLIGMNVMLAEIKDRHLADFEDDEQLHRAAWKVETAARHGMTTCERSDATVDDRAQVHARLATATRELDVLLRQHALSASPLTRVAGGYLEFGQRVGQGDVCERLSDPQLGRQRLRLDEEITDAWISKLRELRLAILDKEQAAQSLGTWTSAAGVAFGVLAFVAAAVIARFVARGVTVPLSLLAGQARRVGEGDFSRLPAIEGPFEVAQLAQELERMRAHLAEVNQLKEAFLGSVSHDLRTPLAHMREALGLLVDGTLGPLNSQQSRVAELAMRACEREVRLVSALLDLSRVRSGRPLMLTPGQAVDDILAHAIEHVGEDALRAEVSLRIESDTVVPPLLLDAMLVEAALVNLLANAITASPRGGVIRVGRDMVDDCPTKPDKPGPWLRIAVIDQGPGVVPELREKIFEPFFTHSVGGHSGSGLGLPLAREMIRGHGGDLSLSDAATGATFVIWLPIAQSQPAPAPRRSHAESQHLTSSLG